MDAFRVLWLSVTCIAVTSARSSFNVRVVNGVIQGIRFPMMDVPISADSDVIALPLDIPFRSINISLSGDNIRCGECGDRGLWCMQITGADGGGDGNQSKKSGNLAIGTCWTSGDDGCAFSCSCFGADECRGLQLVPPNVAEPEDTFIRGLKLQNLESDCGNDPTYTWMTTSLASCPADTLRVNVTAAFSSGKKSFLFTEDAKLIVCPDKESLRQRHGLGCDSPTSLRGHQLIDPQSLLPADVAPNAAFPFFKLMNGATIKQVLLVYGTDCFLCRTNDEGCTVSDPSTFAVAELLQTNLAAGIDWAVNLAADRNDVYLVHDNVTYARPGGLFQHGRVPETPEPLRQAFCATRAAIYDPETQRLDIFDRWGLHHFTRETKDGDLEVICNGLFCAADTNLPLKNSTVDD